MYTLIWDYNGTIVDDAELCLAIENKMLRERGMKYGYSMEEYQHMFCFPVQSYYRKLGYDFQNESYEALSVEFNRLYDQDFSSCSLIPHVKEKLEEAKSKRFRCIIISASRQDKLEAQIRLQGLDGYFEAVLGIDNLLAGSKVERAKKWIDDSRIDPAECRLIGDTLHDLETAQAIGVRHCTLVAQGHQAFDVLKKRWPATVRTMEEVVL